MVKKVKFHLFTLNFLKNNSHPSSIMIITKTIIIVMEYFMFFWNYKNIVIVA